MKKTLLSLALLSLTSLLFAQRPKDFAKMPFLIKEAKEKGDIKRSDSMAQEYINGYLFNLKEDELFTKENLGFIGAFLGNEKSKGFRLFMKDPAKVNRVLGEYQAEKNIMLYINKNYLPQGDFKQIKKPDWDSLEKVVVAKFGGLGQEIIYGQKMIYYWATEDWRNYGIWYEKYFKKAFKHPIYHVNNFSWDLFEHVGDKRILCFGLDVIKYALENGDQNNIEAYDTYANLLHKIGKTTEAIKWEEKAVQMKKGQPDEKTYTDALEKMKKGLPTWTTPVNN